MENTSLDRSKKVIDKFLRKYIALPNDEDLCKRTIERLEASQKNGFNTNKNLASKWCHIISFFKYINRGDMVLELVDWKEKIKKTEFNSGDFSKEFADMFKRLGTSFDKSPTRGKGEFILLAAFLYTMPCELSEVLGLKIFDITSKPHVFGGRYFQSKALNGFAEVMIQYIHRPVDILYDNPLFTLTKGAAQKKMAHHFGSHVLSRLKQRNN
jgi:hypothetical protein